MLRIAMRTNRSGRGLETGLEGSLEDEGEEGEEAGQNTAVGGSMDYRLYTEVLE